jgi:hypothetical protein
MAKGLTIFQQVFALSMEICSASPETGSADALQKILTANLKTLLANPAFAGTDEWALVWGPVVWQSPYSQVVDQAAAVCYNKTANVYVTPISATNPRSAFDVFLEDAATPPAYMVANPANAGALSYGNYVGLQALLALVSGGQTLQAYLQGVASQSATLVFNGHSLGGGLTPLLAYALYPQGSAGSGWKAVYTYPTAGPATADSAFQAAYNAAYPSVVSPAGGYQRWNSNQYNARDVVPHAWSGCADSVGPNLNQVTASVVTPSWGMYYTSFDISVEVVALRTLALALATDPNSGVNPFIPVNNYQLFDAGQPQRITSNALLAANILRQHVTAYVDTFGVAALFPNDMASLTIRPPLLPLAGMVAGAATFNAAAQAAMAAELELHAATLETV